MRRIIEVPFLGVNDTECKLSSWEIPGGQQVKKGAILCVLETTKTSIDVEAEFDGFYYPVAPIGGTISVGQPLCLFSAAQETGDIGGIVKSLMKEQPAQEALPLENRFTKKAQILLERNHLDPDTFLGLYPADKKIGENEVLGYLKQNQESNKRKGIRDLERIAIIGGVSGGGALILIDSLLTTRDKVAVCIFDRDEKFYGQRVLGVPVVGAIDRLEEYLNEDKVDSVIIAFNRNLVERTRVFEELKAKGVKFANVIDPNVQIRSGVTLGTGNVILSNTYIGACSEIGNNNFISANVFLEHGNIVGNGCAFGPGVFTSGNVTIGSGVRFGTGIFVEPNISIGDNAVIASGAILTENVKGDTVIRVITNQQGKPLH